MDVGLELSNSLDDESIYDNRRNVVWYMTMMIMFYNNSDSVLSVFQVFSFSASVLSSQSRASPVGLFHQASCVVHIGLLWPEVVTACSK